MRSIWRSALSCESEILSLTPRELRQHGDGGHRALQVVHHHGRQVVLQTLDLGACPQAGLGRRAGGVLDLVEPAALDHQGQTIRNQLQQTAIVVGETPALARAHMKDPEDASVRQDRDTEERAHLALEQRRIAHIVSGDGLDHDRPLLLGHPPGEALPEGNGHLARPRHVEADRVMYPQALRLLVEEENHGDVHGEHPVDADEQLGQRLVQREMRERQVGHRLHPLDDLDGPLGLAPRPLGDG